MVVVSQGCSDAVNLSVSVHNSLFGEVSFPEMLETLHSSYALKGTWLIGFSKERLYTIFLFNK